VFRVGKRHGFRAASILIGMILAERGDLIILIPHRGPHHAEGFADGQRAGKQAENLVRRGIGGDIEILGHTAHEDIADAAARPQGRETGLLQAPGANARAGAQRCVNEMEHAEILADTAGDAKRRICNSTGSMMDG
jgi:hypothetical protein